MFFSLLLSLFLPFLLLSSSSLSLSLSFNSNPQITSSWSPCLRQHFALHFRHTLVQSIALCTVTETNDAPRTKNVDERGRASGSACRGFGGGHRRRLKSNRLEHLPHVFLAVSIEKEKGKR